LIAGCASELPLKTEKTSDQSLVLTTDSKVSNEGLLSYGAVVFAENPTTLLEAGDFHGYEFDGKAGGIVTVTMTSTTCGAPDTTLYLFGPEYAKGHRGSSLIENDDAFLPPCSLDSQIKSFTLPVDGRYLVVATSFLQQGGGHYKLQLTCENNACVAPAAPTLAASQIAQTDIDHGVFTPAQLFDIGDFAFKHIFRTDEGMGNALTGLPANNQRRPNFRQLPNNVHFASFGAPEAQSCVTCHNIGGDDGAGDLNHNIFQIGDGVNRSSGLPRNPPALLGNGYRQAIGAEMTTDLQGELAAAKAQAAATGVPVTKALASKGISFGSLVVNPDGSVNFAGVVGVDTDLIIRPFGWKGREATLRRFIEGSFRMHSGLQAAPSLAKNCPNANTFGSGGDCTDPDGDGVRNEITEGLLSAEAVYLGLRETPVRVPAATAAAQTRANTGETLFTQIGCASCHTPKMALHSPIHVEPADTTGGAGITLNLLTDNKAPHPASNADGSMTVELWSDFKRHKMGAALADSKNFNQIAADQFITAPLWGVADSAPYLHDGRAPTLNDAILQHAGDAQAVRNSYAALTVDQQSEIQEFLGSLHRPEMAMLITCHNKHAFTDISTSPSPLPLSSGGCQPDGCGLNGVWMGIGVYFRTLYLPTNGIAPLNEANIRISGFTTKNNDNLSVDVQGQELVGVSNNQVVVSSYITDNDSNHTPSIKGAHLLLEHVNNTSQPDMTYTLTITDVEHPSFWANGSGPSSVTLYDFDVTASDGCEVALCQPGLDDNNTDGLIGRAVIFRGDYYSNNYQVSLSPQDTTSSASIHPDSFNIACVNTDIHKLHMLRHTTASSWGTSSPSRDERQALLRLLTGDFCGNGTPFTKNGTPIRLGFKDPAYAIPLPPDPTYPTYSMSNASSIEALWSEDGASCINPDKLRLNNILTQIQDLNSPTSCPDLQYKRCNPLEESLTTLNDPSSSAQAISGNP
jgi:hypothetical protein